MESVGHQIAIERRFIVKTLQELSIQFAIVKDLHTISRVHVGGHEISFHYYISSQYML